jgi:hypothetical protein
MPKFLVSLQQLEQYQLEVEADSPDAAKAMAAAVLQGYPSYRETARRTDGTSPNAYSAEQIGGKPTVVLHDVSLSGEEVLPNGYVVARSSDGHLRIHDRDSFHGYSQPWGKGRFMISWNDHRAGIWRKRATFKTQRGADAALRAAAMLYEPNRMKAAQ